MQFTTQSHASLPAPERCLWEHWQQPYAKPRHVSAASTCCRRVYKNKQIQPPTREATPIANSATRVKQEVKLGPKGRNHRKYVTSRGKSEHNHAVDELHAHMPT